MHGIPGGTEGDYPNYHSLKKPESVKIVDNNVILLFKKRSFFVSLLEIIKPNNEIVFYGAQGVTITPGGVFFGVFFGTLLIVDISQITELNQLLNKYRSHYYWGDFDKIAKDYHSLAIKPTITEEQRKYIVQANSMNEKKDYLNAIKLYNTLIEKNPIAYPAAYYNLALISAQTGNYLYAIVNMKKYLLLVPESEDARAAQDKIYEWEAEIVK
jgi:tetratricopeptide (TPR) repeat protein